MQNIKIDYIVKSDPRFPDKISPTKTMRHRTPVGSNTGRIKPAAEEGYAFPVTYVT